MAESGITLRIAGTTATLTLEREHCLDIAGKNSICELARKLGGELGAVRALIVCATHPGAWGVDVAELADMPQAQARDFSRSGHKLAASLADLPIPVIAAVDAPALGGGCELVLACDIAFAGERASFGQIEALGGVIPAFGGTWRLEERVGYQRALAMMFTGEVVDAPKAKQFGLVLEVYTSSMLLERTREFADRVAAASVQSVAAIKRVTRVGRGATAALRNQLEEEAFPLLFGSEQQERMRRFLEQQASGSQEQV